MISASADIDSVVRCIQMGAEDHLGKPFDPVLLEARVGACLEKKRLRDKEHRLLATVQRQADALAEWNQTLERRVAEQVEELERMARLRRFLSPQLADLVVSKADENVLESHRRDIAVLFVDLSGFTTFSETSEPEDVMAVLRGMANNAEPEALWVRVAEDGPDRIVIDLGDEEGRAVCARGLAPLVPIAERHRVTLCMELLNSKIDHPDYQCDHTAWGVALAKQINSARFKLLYDIYHMQIMEGDVIRTVTENINHIGHFHTGGVPGRHEIDDTQELNYHRVMQAIADAGFQGYVAQEFVPTRDPRASLEQAVRICTV